jgi:hypothetical protein
VDSPICDYCTESDSIIHRFVGCQQMRVFWSDFVRWWEAATSLILNLTSEIILLGNYKSTSYSLNSCILLAKYFIHLQKCKLLPVNFSSYKVILRHHKLIEKSILIKNDNVDTFVKRWEPLLLSLVE